MPRRRRTPALAVLATVALAGCGGGSDEAANDDTSSSSAEQAFNAVDVRFTQSMLPHHMQALRNAEIQVEQGSDPAVKIIATKIIKTQKQEIAKMQGFLKTFGASEKPPPADQQAVWDANTAALRSAETPEARDVVFLTNMVPHHSAAVPMSQLDITQGKFPEAKTLAMEIKKTQRAEIKEMNTIIREKAGS